MKKQLIAALVLVFGVAAVGTVSAQANKPRVREVNQRLKNQHRRVEQGEKNGALTQKQANHIERQDARINREKRRMMARDGGHLTKQDQRRLNRQENHVSNEINRDEKANTAAPAPAGQQ